MLNKFLKIVEAPIVYFSRVANKPASVPNRTDQKTVPLGIILESDQPFNLTATDLSRHCYILGRTGCGKTTTILNVIQDDIEREHSVVILDLRGDLVSGVISMCARLNISTKRITLLDLREKERIQGFNPLSGAGEPYIRALHLLEVLAQEAQSWGVQLEETLRSALLLLAESNKPITDLERIFFDSDMRSACMTKCSDEFVVRFWERYGNLSAEKQQTWALPVLNKVTSLLAVPTLRHILQANSALNLDKILNAKGQIVLISLAVDELHRSSRIMGGLLVSAISREMMARVNIPEASRNPVRLYVDEFENMASSAFESLIAEGRRFKLSLVLSHQTLSQLDNKLRSVIRNNVGVQIIFQVGFEDALTIQRELPKDSGQDAIRSLTTGQAIVMWPDVEWYRVQFRGPQPKFSEYLTSLYRAHILSKLQIPKAPIIPPSPASPQVSATNLDWEDLL